jgi:hypothetical protein
VADLPDWAIDADDIPNHMCLLRRVPPNRLDGIRPDTSNFQNKEAGFGLSVTLWVDDNDLEDVRRRHGDYGVTTIVAADARALGLIISRNALVGNLNHCELFPTISKGRRNLLRNATEWVTYPQVIPPEARHPVAHWREHWEPRIPPDEVARVCK